MGFSESEKVPFSLNEKLEKFFLDLFTFFVKSICSQNGNFLVSLKPILMIISLLKIYLLINWSKLEFVGINSNWSKLEFLRINSNWSKLEFLGINFSLHFQLSKQLLPAQSNKYVFWSFFVGPADVLKLFNLLESMLNVLLLIPHYCPQIVPKMRVTFFPPNSIAPRNRQLLVVSIFIFRVKYFEASQPVTRMDLLLKTGECYGLICKIFWTKTTFFRRLQISIFTQNFNFYSKFQFLLIISLVDFVGGMSKWRFSTECNRILNTF